MGIELEVPRVASEDPEAVEICRVWVADGSAHFALKNVWGDSAAWGVFLADLAQEIGVMLAEQNGTDENDEFVRVLDGLSAELRSGTE